MSLFSFKKVKAGFSSVFSSVFSPIFSLVSSLASPLAVVRRFSFQVITYLLLFYTHEGFSAQAESQQGWFSFVASAEAQAAETSDLSPDKISFPAALKTRTPEQIKAVFFSLKKQHENKRANLWFLDYRQAEFLREKDRGFFCQTMDKLSKDSDFPLKHLSQIQSYEFCPHPEEQLAFEPLEFPKWLRMSLAEAFYRRRKQFEKSGQTLSATIYLGENSPYKELRVSYLKHALSLAEEQKKSAEEIQAIKDLLYKDAPRLKPNPRAEDWFSIAEDLRENRQFQTAQSFYAKVLNLPESSFEEKDRCFQGLSRIYKAQKNRKKQRLNDSQWANWLLSENTEQSLKKRYQRKLKAAHREWNADKNQKAIQTITEILEDEKSIPIRPEALRLRGLIYAQENQTELSLKDWDQALEILSKKPKPSPLREKLLWKKSWFFISQGENKQALHSLRQLEKGSIDQPYTHYRSLFWKGKTLQELGRGIRAKDSWRDLIKKDYFGYYGLLARKLLNKKPEFGDRETDPKDLSFRGDTKDAILIHWLIALNKTKLLSGFLDDRQQSFFKQKDPSKEDWLRMIWILAQAKRYLTIFQSLEKMDTPVKAWFLKNHTKLLFPMDFKEEVEQAAKKWAVPKALVFAVIRQESAFNTRARSLADAFGLMQLIPSTARATARKHKIPYKGYRDLYKPSTNILLGSAHLKRLLDRYDGHFALSLSAYNAGSTPVNQWKQKLEDMETIEFIENIPYEETRNYVRLLIRNYIFYHEELKREEGWFPEWLLQPSQPK